MQGVEDIVFCCLDVHINCTCKVTVQISMTLIITTTIRLPISFELSSLPDIWRVAVVSPIFKKGLSFDVRNYRPISLTCIVCKVMESIVKD